MRNGARLRGLDFARQRKDPTVVAGCKRPPDRSLPRRLRRAYLEQTRVSARATVRGDSPAGGSARSWPRPLTSSAQPAQAVGSSACSADL